MIISDNSYSYDFKLQQTVAFSYDYFRKAIRSHRPPQLIVVNDQNYLKCSRTSKSGHPASSTIIRNVDGRLPGRTIYRTHFSIIFG